MGADVALHSIGTACKLQTILVDGMTLMVCTKKVAPSPHVSSSKAAFNIRNVNGLNVTASARWTVLDLACLSTKVSEHKLKAAVANTVVLTAKTMEATVTPATIYFFRR